MPRRLARASRAAAKANAAEAKRRGRRFFNAPKPFSLGHRIEMPKKGFSRRVFRTVPGDYFDWMAGFDNPVFRDPKYFSYLRASRAGGRTFQERVPHAIGTGTIIEICEKQKGKPDFLVFVRRSRNVSLLPGMIALPGGMLELKEEPHENVLRELPEEFGFKKAGIKFVGPGLKLQRSQKNPLALTTMVDERSANPSISYVVRLNASRRQVLAAMKGAKDNWETGNVLFVPRTPEDIAKFLQEHKKDFWDQQAVRKYLDELMPGWRKKLRKLPVGRRNA
jgi:8-oxo-dGTP pyrophosphatase MutT (NUDIX family)